MSSARINLREYYNPTLLHKVYRSLLSEEPRGPLTCTARVKNALRYQYRGVLSVVISISLVILLNCVPAESFTEKQRTVIIIWSMMFVFFFLTPMGHPMTGMLPIVAMPLFAIMSTTIVAVCYFGEALALMLLGGMMSMIVNNTGLDKRLSLWILSIGSVKMFSGPWFIFKAGFAAFLNAIVGHRLLSCVTIYDVLGPVTEPFAIRDYVNMAVQTSSTIGSIAPLHGCLTILAARAMYYQSDPKKTDFNYLSYAMYSVPCCIIMFCGNIMYYMTLVKRYGGLTESESSSLQYSLQKTADDQPPKNSHQYLAIIFITLYFITCFLRGANPTLFNEQTSDATIAVIFVFALHVLPRHLEFLEVLKAKTTGELPEQLKPSSAILWWRFVDKNTPYAYMFLIGGGVALVKACKEVKLDVSDDIPKIAIFLLVPMMSCFISHTAVTVTFLPMIGKMNFLDAFIVGVGSALSFTMPFRYTPAYFCHHKANTPKNRMMRIGLGSTIICGVLLAVFAMSADAFAPGVVTADGGGSEVVGGGGGGGSGGSGAGGGGGGETSGSGAEGGAGGGEP